MRAVVDDKTLEKMLKEYVEGDLSNREIADKYGIGYSTFNRYRAKSGILPKGRNSSSNKRKNAIEDEHYFDELNKDKMKVLAFLFVHGSVFGINTEKKMLNIQVKQKDKQETIDVLSSFTNISEDSFVISGKYETLRARFRSEGLGDRLLELGVKKELPCFEDKELNETFYDYYIERFSSFDFYEMRIGLGYNDIGGLKKYLIDMGIDADNIVKKGGGIRLSDEDSLVLVIKRYPELLKKMVDHYNQKEWSFKMSRVLNRVRNEI